MSHRRGFTLIEILVVMAIIAVATVIMINSFGTSRVARELEANSREVVVAIRQMQAYALTGRQIVANTAPCRFEVLWNAAPATATTYVTRYWYRDGSGACTQSQVIETSPLGNATFFGNGGSFFFTLPHGNLSAPSTLVLCKNGQGRTIVVDANGLINDLPGGAC